MAAPGEEPPVRTLLSDILSRITVLIRKEFDLARSEMAQNFSRAAAGAGMLAVGAIIALVALNVLAIAGVIALQAAGIDLIWATLIVGGAALLLALILVMVGINRLKLNALAPTRTEREVRRDIDTVKEALDA